MDSVAFILSLIVLVVSSMNLSLSVVLRSRKKSSIWTGWNIVLCGALLGMSLFYTYNMMSRYLPYSENAKRVLSIVFNMLFTLDVGFVSVFVCRFVTWFIARPMSNFAIGVTFISGVCFVTLQILNEIFHLEVFTILSPIFPALNILYCLIKLLISLRTVEDKLTKNLALTFSIISFCMIPLLVIASVFSFLRSFSLIIVCLSYFIMHMDFMYVSLYKSKKDLERVESNTLDIEKYHITDKEEEVINLIKKGLTSKEIAYSLKISQNTVNNHIQNIFQKVGVRSRIDLLNVLHQGLW